jgi:phosphoribosylpyrophosphate synthetase
VTYDIHALGEQFYFDDRVQVELRSAMPMLIRRLKKLGEPVSICFPDEGAGKRFGRIFEEAKLPIIVCSKVRDGQRRVVTVKEGETLGVHAVIVDDLIQSGGTIHECRKALIERGAAKVSVFATHPVMPHFSFLKFTAADYANVWVTDSVPETTMYLENKKPYEVLSLAHELRAAIFG